MQGIPTQAVDVESLGSRYGFLPRLSNRMESAISSTGEEESMRRDEIMKADLLSEVLLLGSGLVILVSMLMILIVAAAQGT